MFILDESTNTILPQDIDDPSSILGTKPSFGSQQDRDTLTCNKKIK